MATKTVKAIKVTLVLDQEWLNAVSEVLSYAEPGEVCRWEDMSEWFDLEVEDEEEEV